MKMKCDKCSKLAEETETSSCALGGIEITDYISVDKERLNKLCTFDDLFFCPDCMVENLCVDCNKLLTSEEKQILKKQNKI